MTAPGEALRRVAFPRSELPDGARRVVTVGRREIVVVNAAGALRALANRCPHRQAPLDRGLVCAAPARAALGEPGFEPGRQVLRCPWHRYEFDLETGRCLVEPDRYRVKTYEVRVEGHEIAVYA